MLEFLENDKINKIFNSKILKISFFIFLIIIFGMSIGFITN